MSRLVSLVSIAFTEKSTRKLAGSLSGGCRVKGEDARTSIGYARRCEGTWHLLEDNEEAFCKSYKRAREYGVISKNRLVSRGGGSILDG